jgi:L-threonylcarbamoyladenylate synthase
MNPETIPIDAVGALERAAEVLRAGGVAAFPTDTVYGIGAMAFNTEAVKRLYEIKERPVEKSIPVLIGDESDAMKVATAMTPMAQILAEAFWPGGLTIVLPKCPDVPDVVAAGRTIGVRIPNHEPVRALLRLTGPLAVTSANRSGGKESLTAQEVLAALGGRIDLLLDGGACPGGVPSTVVECAQDRLIILRQGPVTEEAIRRVLHEG